MGIIVLGLLIHVLVCNKQGVALGLGEPQSPWDCKRLNNYEICNLHFTICNQEDNFQSRLTIWPRGPKKLLHRQR
jgi:hypothetical protein